MAAGLWPASPPGRSLHSGSESHLHIVEGRVTCQPTSSSLIPRDGTPAPATPHHRPPSAATAPAGSGGTSALCRPASGGPPASRKRSADRRPCSPAARALHGPHEDESHFHLQLS